MPIRATCPECRCAKHYLVPDSMNGRSKALQSVRRAIIPHQWDLANGSSPCPNARFHPTNLQTGH